MASDIVVSISHDLGTQEAQRRIMAGLEHLRSEFASKITTADVSWDGPHADVRVGALGKTIAAQLDVEERQVRITIQLPGMLSALSKPITRFLQRRGTDVLKLPYRP